MTELSKEQRRLSQTVEIYEKYKGILSDIETAKEMLNDKDMQEFAKEEKSELTSKQEKIEKELEVLLLPHDAAWEPETALPIPHAAEFIPETVLPLPQEAELAINTLFPIPAAKALYPVT